MNNFDSHLTDSYIISGSKALIGAAFIEYFFYGVLYMIETSRLKEYEEESQPAPPRQT